MGLPKLKDYLQHVDVEGPRNLQSAAPGPFSQSHRRVLSRTLSSATAFCIAFNTVLGVGILQNTTYAISVVGRGALLAFFIVSIVMGCVMATISELIGIFPIANAMPEIVHRFVDEDLAALVGPTSWFAYSVLTSTLIISASNLLQYSFSLSQATSSAVAISLAAYLAITNLLPVRIFGWIALTAGVVNFGLLSATLGVLTYGATELSKGSSESESFGSNGSATSTDGQAMCLALALAVFPFLGLESIATTGAETFNNAQSVRKQPYIFWVVAVAVHWTVITSWIALGRESPIMGVYTSQGLGGIIPYPNYRNASHVSNLTAPLAVIEETGIPRKHFEVLFAISILYAANTALYIASRALFGVSLQIARNWRASIVVTDMLGRVSYRTRVPGSAVLTSVCSFFWVVLLTTTQSNSSNALLVAQTLSSMATVGVVMTWATQCLAYVRFQYHYKKYASRLSTKTSRVLKKDKYTAWLFFSCQPYSAWVGLVGCIVLILVFNSTAFWSNAGSEDFTTNFIGVCAVPLYVSFFWLFMKMRRYFKWSMDRQRQAKLRDVLFPSITDANDFEQRVLALSNRIYPTDYPIERDSTEPSPNQNILRGSTVKVVDRALLKHNPSELHLNFSNHKIAAPSTSADSTLGPAPPPAYSRHASATVSHPRYSDDAICVISREGDINLRPLAARSALVATPSAGNTFERNPKGEERLKMEVV